jgi:two-component system, NarL family, sensor histidine kinase UhpB
MSLFWRIFSLNAAVLTVAALLLLFGPVTVSSRARFMETVVVLAGVAVVLAANAVLLRLALTPLERLTRTMTTIDLLHPGTRLAVGGDEKVAGRGGIVALIRAFNAMLERLESERATSAARALSAQEAERHRIAQELHDEIGQTLTAVLLDLKRVADQAPPPVRDQIRQVQETTRNSLDEIRRIARRLRPGVLEELGLSSALRALANEFSTAGLSVRKHVGKDLPVLDKEIELVVYRVAQEGLTNAARHSRARTVDLMLRRDDGGVELCVSDDGRGVRGAPEGAGIRGMRERALLIGAALTVGRSDSGGTAVRLHIPVAVG